MKIGAPKGTRYILPPEINKWHYIESIIREVMNLYSFYEIRTPIFEYTELFQRGIGDTTDIVNKEMYTFLDKKGRSITLRPENTASVVRAYIEHKMYGLGGVGKFYYIGPMFRYERPQAGRQRQFHQYGMEIIGTKDPKADVEIIKATEEIYKRLGFTDYKILINSVGCPKCRPYYEEELKLYLKDKYDQLCDDCKVRYHKNPLRILDCKREGCRRATESAPKIIDYLCEECKIHFEKVLSYLDALNIKYEINHRLVRGLDYYTKTAFEVIAGGLGAQDAVGGGGRYDGLAQEIGGKEIPGVGFAGGMERLILALSHAGIEFPREDIQDLFVVFREEVEKEAFALIFRLREKGVKADYALGKKSIKAQLKEADKKGVKYVVIIGEEEVEKKILTLKNMETGEGKKITEKELYKLFEKE